jgi:hypothetical protein
LSVCQEAFNWFLFTLTGVLVERSAALIFKDTSYETRITALALAVVYIGLLGYASSVGD